MMSPVILTIATVAGVAIVIAITLALLRRYAVERGRVARQRFPDAVSIIPGAQFLGRESVGAFQLRGNGTLVLTHTEIYFEMWFSNREYHIPLTAIRSLETVASFLGKTVLRPLLKINFLTDTGQNDAMVWLVSDLDNVRLAIEQARGQSPGF
jgi:hypothetical protein